MNIGNLTTTRGTIKFKVAMQKSLEPISQHGEGFKFDRNHDSSFVLWTKTNDVQGKKTLNSIVTSKTLV